MTKRLKTYRDIPGDGGSNVVEQLVQQRSQIDAQLAHVTHVVAVGSGKGGVGKSTLALLLALACRSLGKKVAVLDADFNGPSIATLSGLKNCPPIPSAGGMIPPQTEDGVAVFSTGASLPDGVALDFESVLQGDSFVWRATKEFSVLAEILAACVWGERDLLFVDLPPGPERTVQFVDFLGKRTKVVLVTIPTDVATSVVRRGNSSLNERGATILGYIQNMNGYLNSETNQVQPLFPVDQSAVSPDAQLKQAGVAKLGDFPFDPMLAASCNRGLSLAALEQLPSFEQVVAIASALIASLEEHDEVSVC